MKVCIAKLEGDGAAGKSLSAQPSPRHRGYVEHGRAHLVAGRKVMVERPLVRDGLYLLGHGTLCHAASLKARRALHQPGSRYAKRRAQLFGVRPCQVPKRVYAHGGKALTSISVFKGGKTETLSVDALAMSGGFNPTIHLACQRGERPTWSDENGAFIVPDQRKGLTLAGSVATTNGLAACLEAGAAKAAALLGDLGFAAQASSFGAVEGDIVPAAAKPVWSIPGIKGSTDINVFAGSAKNWKNWVSAVSQPQQVAQN